MIYVEAIRKIYVEHNTSTAVADMAKRAVAAGYPLFEHEEVIYSCGIDTGHKAGTWYSKTNLRLDEFEVNM